MHHANGFVSHVISRLGMLSKSKMFDFKVLILVNSGFFLVRILILRSLEPNFKKNIIDHDTSKKVDFLIGKNRI